MNIIERKYRLIEQFLSISNPDEVEKVEQFFKEEIKQVDFWDQLPEQVKKTLHKSKTQSENEQVVAHDEVIKKARTIIKAS